MKFKEGDWIIRPASSNMPKFLRVEKILKIDRSNNKYTFYYYADNAVYKFSIHFLGYEYNIINSGNVIILNISWRKHEQSGC